MGKAGDPTSFAQTQASVWLDALRATAALIVLLSHWRYLLFVELHTLHSHHWLYSVPYVLTAGGPGAVIVFFVLSGYLVGGSALRAFQNGRWSWRSYLTHRLVRLWVVLLPALLLGLVWDVCQIRTMSQYSGAEPAAFIAGLKAHISWKLFAANALFLQGARFPTFGSNGPLWSLSYEFWYYMLFPLALCALWPGRYRPAVRLLWVLVFVAAAAVTGQVVTGQALLLFPAWLLGVALHFVPTRPLGAWPRCLAVLAFGVCFMGMVPFKLHFPYLSQLTLAAASAVLMWVLLGDRRAARERALDTRLARGSARFSYTLYIVHMPALVLLSILVGSGNGNWYPDARHLAWGAALLGLVVLYSWLVSLATEAHTDKVRRWVEQTLP